MGGVKRRSAFVLVAATRNGSATAFRRCWLFDTGISPLFGIKDGYLWIWMSFLYLLRCLLGCFVCFISGLQLSIDRHIKLPDERRSGACWRRNSLFVDQTRSGSSSWA
jgi:hypothetical protein